MFELVFLVAIGLCIGLKLKRVWTVVFTILIIALPVSDEIIGTYQFKKLCEKYEVVQSVTPNQSYEKLEVNAQINIKLTDAIKPTAILVEQYTEAKSRVIVRSDRTVSQKDGWILRWLGLASTSNCKNALIWRLSPQEKDIRFARGWAHAGTGQRPQQVESSTNGVDFVLKKFDIDK